MLDEYFEEEHKGHTKCRKTWFGGGGVEPRVQYDV